MLHHKEGNEGKSVSQLASLNCLYRVPRREKEGNEGVAGLPLALSGFDLGEDEAVLCALCSWISAPCPTAIKRELVMMNWNPVLLLAVLSGFWVLAAAHALIPEMNPAADDFCQRLARGAGTGKRACARITQQQPKATGH